MVGSIRNTSNPTPAQSRKAAQRKLAKEIREGTFKPSNIGKKARGIASERRNIIDKVRAYKNGQYSSRPKFNQGRSDKVVPEDPDDLENRPISELRILSRAVDILNDRDFWVSDVEVERASAFYYH